MLQRAASNAYSWWWASHIRTKQSKWLEQNLQDMEEKVQNVLKLIEEDGDSFAKRAEMYYKKRPELISFVEESFRAYRALADRYDHMSKELQNANNTIAYVFPEEVQFAMEEDEEEPSNNASKKTVDGSKSNAPKVPKIPKDLKGLVSTAAKRIPQPKHANKTAVSCVSKSGLSKKDGTHEIDKLQKQILAFQTEKEFVKESYESGVAKYWEIDQKIREMQEKVCSLQDEFGTEIVIEDDEARTLMASVALKSCNDTLAQLKDTQERSVEEALVQKKRIEDARTRLKQLNNENVGEVTRKEGDRLKKEDNEKQSLEVFCEKIKEQYDIPSTFTVSEMAEKIDDLVNKVISLETSVSSQTALIQRLTLETDELNAQIASLEEENSSLILSKKDLNDKLREMEDKLDELQRMNQKVEEQNKNFTTHFTEANFRLDHLSGKVINVDQVSEMRTVGSQLSFDELMRDRSDAGQDVAGELKMEEKISESPDLVEDEKGSSLTSSKLEEKQLPEIDITEEPERVGMESNLKVEDEVPRDLKEGEPSTKAKLGELLNISADMEKGNEGTVVDRDVNGEGVNAKEAGKNEDDEPDWKQLFMDGLENREKVLLTEYTTVLRNFKKMKKKLSEADTTGGKNLFDVTVQLMKLKKANTEKDEQIQVLRQKLNFLQEGWGNEDELQRPESTIKGEMLDLKLLVAEPLERTSEIETKFRGSIDQVLEENLEFWLRFSSTFQQIQKFEVEVKDLLFESAKIEEKTKKQEGSSTPRMSLKSDAKPLYKHLKEIHAELVVWIEKSTLLKEELKSRFSSLCDLQEEITMALKESAADEEFKFTSYQAAKFYGEILNMKQENNKVADELQAGLDHITTLQLEVERSLAKLNEKFRLSGSKNNTNIQLQHSESRSRIPLRSFIFGVKHKKQRNSILSCMHPGLYRKHQGLRLHPSK